MTVSSSTPERTFKINGTRIYQEPPDFKLKEFQLKDPEFELSLCISVSLRHNLRRDPGRDVFEISLELELVNPSECINHNLEFSSVEEIQNWLWSPKLKKELCSIFNNHLLPRVICDFSLRVGSLKTVIEEDLKKRQSLLETCL